MIKELCQKQLLVSDRNFCYFSKWIGTLTLAVLIEAEVIYLD